jgi:DNA-binding CsgD family transcriptional regulator
MISARFRWRPGSAARCGAQGMKGVPRGRQPATRANPAGLTARQLDVLELVREGLTDAEIAQRLVLSVRTVNHHVAAVLIKLDGDNRRDAARRDPAPWAAPAVADERRGRSPVLAVAAGGRSAARRSSGDHRPEPEQHDRGRRGQACAGHGCSCRG